MSRLASRMLKIENRITPGQFHVIRVNNGCDKEQALKEYRKTVTVAEDDTVIYRITHGQAST